MANRIQLRRGTKPTLPTLSQGEPGHCTDTGETFIGTAYGNVHMDGDKWFKGTAMSGTSTTTGAYSYSACPPVKLGDTYLNTSNGNVYECTTAGSGNNAKWTYRGCLKGPQGPQGESGGLPDGVKIRDLKNVSTLNYEYVSGGVMGIYSNPPKIGELLYFYNDTDYVINSFEDIDTNKWEIRGVKIQPGQSSLLYFIKNPSSEDDPGEIRVMLI